MKSCVKPDGSTTCPYDYLLVALQALVSKVEGNCPDCTKYVFGKIRSSADQVQFARFISRFPPGFYDGTRSTLKLFQLCEPPTESLLGDSSYGCYANSVGYFGPGPTVADFFNNDPYVQALAVYQSANAQDPKGNNGLRIFYRPSGICTASIYPTTDCQIGNASTLFHESLHEFYGFGDSAIQRLLGIPVQDYTGNISDYISFTIFSTSSNLCSE